MLNDRSADSAPTHPPEGPVLVTGMPRSGTTWLARLLASAPGCALTGREPMNPRGRQYALGGTLSGWTRLSSPNRRQRVALKTSYLGINPWVFSRYGYRQWAAALPNTRVIVKDPFAMLSMPVIHSVTRATAVVLFRHPGAALTSYRRMGWTPDSAELAPIAQHFAADHEEFPGLADAPSSPTSDVQAMAWFWNTLYGVALYDAAELGRNVIIVAHEDIAAGGTSFGERLFAELGLAWDEKVARKLLLDGDTSKTRPNALHNFDRSPAKVAHDWQSRIAHDERTELERLTGHVYGRLLERSLRL